MMKRIMITGYSGGGKSTLARRLGQILHIDPVHLDKIAWKSGWTQRTSEEACALLTPVLRQERWVIEGNYQNILYEDRLALCDTLVFISTGRGRCFYQVLKRAIQYRGVSRPDMAGGCIEKIDFEFLKWVLLDGRRQTGALFEGLKEFSKEQNKSLFVLHNSAETESFLKTARYYAE